MGQTDRTDGLVGRVIEDRYEVLRKLTDSQLGRIYEARHVTLGRLMTVEVLGPVLASNSAARSCYLRKARQLSRLRHGGIIRAEHCGSTPNDSIYMVMESLPGTTLEAVLRRETKLPWSRVRGIALQLTAALKAAHRRSVLHEGLSPPVIHLWLDEDGNERVKVSSFDMAEVGVVTQRHPMMEEATTRLFGDGRYMPPEQVVEGHGSVQGDVYALAAVLYHMLTGEPPVSAANVFKVVARQGALDIARARSKEPSIPDGVEATLMRALAAVPGVRHQSVHELELELELEEVEADARETNAFEDGTDDDEEDDESDHDEDSLPDAAPPEDPKLAHAPQLVSSSAHAWPLLPVEEVTELIVAGHPPGAPSTELARSRASSSVAGAVAPHLEHPALPVAPIPTSSLHDPATTSAPTHERVLPDPPPPMPMWPMAILAVVLVVLVGIAVGIVIAYASEPDGGVHPKAAGREAGIGHGR